MRTYTSIFLLLVLSSQAFSEASLTVTGVSDYLFTGVSQTDSKPALQTSLDYNFDNGIYVGLWLSNVDFGHDDPANVEQDYYVGWEWQLNDSILMNLAVLRYEYTGAPSDGYDYTNYLIGFTLLENTTINIYFADDQDLYGEDTDGDGKNDRGGRHTWVELEQTIPLTAQYDLVLGADYDKNEEVSNYNGDETGDDYWHWRIGVATNYAGIDVDLAYHDTDIDSTDDPDNVADERIVLSVSKAFEF
jgi:uncharacterized protein (TIGR02001 family)